MNKIYSFIALFLMCFVGSVQAQVHQWSPVDGEEVSVDEIEDGAFYVLKGGANTKADGSTGANAGALEYYLAAGQKPNMITHECVFQFEKTGETVGDDNNVVYRLKNVSNGLYLSGNNQYTANKTQAFKFTARKGVMKAESEIDPSNEWEEYSNAVSDTRSIGADELNTWVLCSPSEKNFMLFFGNPAFGAWIDTNNWLIIKVQEDELSEMAKLSAVFEKYLTDGVDENLYPVGINPGCVSREFYDRLYAVWEKANGVLGKGDQATDEECIASREAIEKIFEEFKTALVPVGVGYFVIKNERGGYLKDNERGFCDNKLTYPVESWNLDNAIYIWQVEEDENAEGGVVFKNYLTKRYLGKGGDYKMVEEPNGAFFTERLSGTTFYMTQNGSGVNVGHNGYLTNWNDKNDPGNHFSFFTVDKVAIDSLTGKIDQNSRNAKLAELVKSAKLDYEALQTKNGFTEDGRYLTAGLASEFLESNATDPSEGKEAYAFDGDFETYFHTSWHTSVAPADNHWVSVDLGKEVKELIVKFTKRDSTHHNGDPMTFKIMTNVDKAENSTDWSVELASTGSDSIEYAYPSARWGDSTTYIGRFPLSEAARYVRFVVTGTKGNQFPAGEGSGPCWHVSEIRFYDAAESVHNPNFDLIPEAVRTALTNAIAQAEKELAEDKATEETYETLDKALKAYWEAYPDPSDLRNQLKDAKKVAENAPVGAEMGYYKEGAKETYLAAIAAIEKTLDDAETTGNALTLVQIKEQEGKLEAATKAFNAQLIVPEGGKIYRIVSTAPVNDNGEDRPQTNAVVMSRDADYLFGTPGWAYKTTDSDIDTRMNALWYVEKTEAGFSFKNLANGLYMNNAYEGLTKDSVENAEIKDPVGYSKTPKYFNLEAYIAEGHDAGSFLVALGFGQFLNMQPTGNMVHWGDRTDAHSPFTFEAVSVEDLDGTYEIDIKGTGKAQILSLPIDLTEVMSTQAYEVLGINGDKIILTEIADEIPAGTPFVILPESKEEVFIEASVAADMTMEGMLGIKYNYEPVVVKGLVSAPVSFETTKEQAYGVLTDGVVYATVGGDRVAAGSGYFNNELPKVEDESEYFLPVDGVISGEGTGIENAVIVKNVASDVYTISGVKVRNNVKAANATKGLPKGIYIVAGKKVVVK